jgi:hypothetical protein
VKGEIPCPTTAKALTEVEYEKWQDSVRDMMDAIDADRAAVKEGYRIYAKISALQGRPSPLQDVLGGTAAGPPQAVGSGAEARPATSALAQPAETGQQGAPPPAKETNQTLITEPGAVSPSPPRSKFMNSEQAREYMGLSSVKALYSLVERVCAKRKRRRYSLTAEDCAKLLRGIDPWRTKP